MSETPYSDKTGGNLAQGAPSVKQGQRGSALGVLKSASTLGGMTLISRILGVFRDIVSARAFGLSWGWDAFIYAFMFPNFFRRVVGEGALSSAFVPVYNETLVEKGQNEAFKFANITLCFITLCLLAFTLFIECILGVLLFSGIQHATLELAVSLLRILFPYLICMFFYALGMGVLNSHKKFFIPSIGPVY